MGSFIFHRPHELADQAQSLLSLESGLPQILAIDGRSGSGKTTLATEVSWLLEKGGVATAIFHLEDLYQGWSGLSQAASAWQHLSEQIVNGDDDAIWFGWDWVAGAPTGPHNFTAAAKARGGVLIAEGVGALCGTHHAGVWVELGSDERKRRALARDGETFYPFWDMWALQEEELFARNRKTYEAPRYIYSAELGTYKS